MMTGVWEKWEGEVINGAYPLRRLLSGSDHSGVFLTECTAQNVAAAAIKIIPADPVFAETQLLHWKTAAALSHPRLIRLLDAGHCRREDQPFLFVVMEYAEETLSQLLPQRALTANEVREMLLPTLEALAFLHDKNLVQGELKPPNVLVVGDQLKLASDNIRPAGEPRTGIAETSLYDPPEAEHGRISAAGDMWALGITLVEALTQRPPERPQEQSEPVALPAKIPANLRDTIRSCLNRNPAERPTAASFEARLKGVPQEPMDSIPRRPLAPVIAVIPVVPVVAVAAVLILVVAVWGGLRLLHRHQDSQQPTAAPVVSVPASATIPAMPPAAASGPVASQPPAPLPAPPPADTATSVLHQEIPDVPQSASATIQGRLNVAVRVTVDASGNVVDETLEHPGPSKYFARLATAAARKWKFAPAVGVRSRECLLWFEFTRGGTTARAANP
jgi:TonB family protein